MRPVIDDSTRRSVALRIIPIILMVTAGAFTFFPTDQRPAIFRLALAAGMILLVMHLIGRVITALRTDDPEGFESALEPARPVVRLDATLKSLRDEVRYSRSSRRYFDRVLWPRLRTLAARNGEAEGDLPPPPPAWMNRGPSLGAIADLVDHLEKKR